MPHPFQCIASVTPQEADNVSFLLAACGPKLLSLSSKDGSIISQWTADAAVSEIGVQEIPSVVRSLTRDFQLVFSNNTN
jgi:hypothetical protein